jgi:hypothetical protein
MLPPAASNNEAEKAGFTFYWRARDAGASVIGTGDSDNVKRRESYGEG